jgi:CBS domain-containing protein
MFTSSVKPGNQPILFRKQLGIETIEYTASAQEASKKMKDKNVSSLVVADEKGKPQAIVSKRDLV